MGDIVRSDIALSDPTKWRAVVLQLQHVKECCENRGVRFMIVPVSTTVGKELPSDRAVALTKAMGIDPK